MSYSDARYDRQAYGATIQSCYGLAYWHNQYAVWANLSVFIYMF